MPYTPNKPNTPNKPGQEAGVRSAPQFSAFWSSVTIAIVVILGGVVGFMLVEDAKDEQVPVEPDSRDGQATTSDEHLTENWPTYTSDQFDFSISYPPDWVVATHTPSETDQNVGLIIPAVNIYKPETLGEETPPFDHFADVVNVSIYPHGIPTEGVVGERGTSSVAFSEQVTDDTYAYILQNEQPWALVARFVDVPDSWKSYGFLWARADIKNMTSTCLRNGEPVSRQECDPLFGDDIVRRGQVNSEEWDTLEAITESFSFHVSE